jgi:hypothetical protein
VEDKRTTVPTSLASVIRGIVSVGGGYGDVIATLRLAKDKGYLADQLAIDPLPAAVRVYYRDEETQSKPEDEKTDTADSSDES